MYRVLFCFNLNWGDFYHLSLVPHKIAAVGKAVMADSDLQEHVDYSGNEAKHEKIEETTHCPSTSSAQLGFTSIPDTVWT